MNQEPGIKNKGSGKTAGHNSRSEGFPGSRIWTCSKEQFLRQRRSSPNFTTGFTLIELIVVMGIITVMTTILVGYSSQSSKQLLLSSKEANMLSLVSRAKFLSIETFFRDLGSSGSPRKICAYGIHVDADEIFIFQDRAPDPPGCDAATNKYEQGVNDARLSGDLDVVRIDSVVMTLGGTLKDVVFIPPDPDVIINNDPGTNSASIDVGLVDGSGSFTITVNNAGQVRAN